jgi:intraflagellar transport protein 122
MVFVCSPCLQAAVPHMPIVLGRAALRRLRLGEVVVRRWPNPCLPAQWFRLLDEDQPVVVGPCGHFFEAEEFEMVSNVRRLGWSAGCCADSC